jgi:membrane protein DedA with SNARE-associated domain
LQELFFNFIEHGSYFALFAVLFIAGLGVPLPEDIPLIAAGYICHLEKAQVGWMVVVGIIVCCRRRLLFNMGASYGTNLLGHRWLQQNAKPWLVAMPRRDRQARARSSFAALLGPARSAGSSPARLLPHGSSDV